VAEPGAECAVVDRAANLQEQIGTSSRPAHLLRLVHSPVDEEIRGTFGNRRSNTQARTIAFGVVHEPGTLAGEVVVDFVQRAPQLAGWYAARAVAAFTLEDVHDLADPLDREPGIFGLAVPDPPVQPLDLLDDQLVAGYPVVVFGGRHADIELDESMGAALGHLVGMRHLACVVDLSELGSSASRRRFMTAFAETVYEANTEPLHLVFDEADLWAPQRPLPEANTLLGRIEEIVRRGRVRGFIPWLITQRPAVVHKDVLSQADILVAMKLTSSQDRDAVGGWIEGQAGRAEGKRILADLPRLSRGEGYVWAPSDGVLARVAFPLIRTYDSSRTPKRGCHSVV
jgi:hypothetical protein